MNTFEIIKTVRLTEKGTRQGIFNQYTVVADTRANKTQIRQAVQELKEEAARRSPEQLFRMQEQSTLSAYD